MVNSIRIAKVGLTKTIFMVKKVVGTKLVAKCAITTLDGIEFVDSKSLLPIYQGEEASETRLCDGDEFDIFYDYFPNKKIYKNAKEI